MGEQPKIAPHSLGGEGSPLASESKENELAPYVAQLEATNHRLVGALQRLSRDANEAVDPCLEASRQAADAFDEENARRIEKERAAADAQLGQAERWMYTRFGENDETAMAVRSWKAATEAVKLQRDRALEERDNARRAEAKKPVVGRRRLKLRDITASVEALDKEKDDRPHLTAAWDYHHRRWFAVWKVGNSGGLDKHFDTMEEALAARTPGTNAPADFVVYTTSAELQGLIQWAAETW